MPVPSDNKSKTGVYAIVHIESGKRYVGSAACSLVARKTRHWSELRSGKHANRYLQAAWVKYGEVAFLFAVLERCPPDRCIEREQFWIDEFCSSDERFGYNLCPTAGSVLGLKRTDDQKAAARVKMEEIKIREDYKEKMRLAGLRRKNDRELVARIAEAGSKVKATPEWKRKQKEGCVRRSEDPDYLSKLREGCVKRNDDPEYRVKLQKAAVLRGVNGSERTRRALQAWKQHKQGLLGKRKRKERSAPS